jgi:hypothetical protein
MADHDFHFFLDRGLGSKMLPLKLRSAGWQITTMDERYGIEVSEDLDDPEWIREATAAGDILLCKDRQIAKNPLEAEAILTCAARIFALASAQITMDQGAGWYLANEERIVRALLHREGPFVFSVHADRIVNYQINKPPGVVTRKGLPPATSS